MPKISMTTHMSVNLNSLARPLETLFRCTYAISLPHSDVVTIGAVIA